MSNEANIRMERVERLLKELRHEITRGMMEGEIDESLVFQFIVPISRSIPDGVVVCNFRTRPEFRDYNLDLNEPRLRLVK